MAAYSLHQRSGSPYWFVSFRVPNPDAAFNPNAPRLKQCTRSTKQKTKSEARKAAHSIVEAAEAEAGAGTDKGRKIYAILTEAAQMAEAGTLNVAESQKFLGRMMEASGGGVYEKHTIRSWLNEWLEGKGSEMAKPGKKSRGKSYSENTTTRYRGIVNHLLNWLPEEKADGSILTLSADDVIGWQKELSNEGRSASTVNLSIKILRAALNAAKVRGYVTSNVTEGVPLLAETEPIRSEFSKEDVGRLIAATDGEWQGMVLAGFYTGASIGDIVRFKWGQVDLVSGSITYTRKKSAVECIIPIYPQLKDWLMEQPTSDDPESFVFPELHKRAVSGNNGLSRSFMRILKRAKVEGKTEKPKGKAGKTRNSLSFHSLRHAFNTELANAGVSVEHRTALSGQSSIAMNEIYTHRDVESLRGFIEAMPGLEMINDEKDQ